MRSGTKRRLGAIERDRRRPSGTHRSIWLRTFTDAELDRLEAFARRRADWPGTDRDWIHTHLTSDERRELDVLLAKVR